jgi:hypothetical protein
VTRASQVTTTYPSHSAKPHSAGRLQSSGQTRLVHIRLGESDDPGGVPHRGLTDLAEGSLGEPAPVQRRSEEDPFSHDQARSRANRYSEGDHGEDSQGVLLLSRFDAALDRPSRCRGPRFEAVNRHAAGSSTHERGLSRAPSSGGGGPASSVRRKALLICAEVPPQLWQHCPRFLSPPLRGRACRISRRARIGGPGKEYWQNGVLNWPSAHLDSDCLKP